MPVGGGLALYFEGARRSDSSGESECGKVHARPDDNGASNVPPGAGSQSGAVGLRVAGVEVSCAWLDETSS